MKYLRIVEFYDFTQEMFLDDMQTHGIYTSTDDDECADLEPDEIQEAYGTFGEVVTHRCGHTGASELDDEEADNLLGVDLENDEEVADEWQDVQTDYDTCFNAPSVRVPRHSNPFGDNEDLQQLYAQALQEVAVRGILPTGFGIRREEWEDGVYLPFELLKTGRRAGQHLRVELPDLIW